ncbi:DEAD/DEAH box helicase [Streptomyces melanogenes]|uniref:Helicase associated domain protein n=1 Tax=Streptomyces melanogenes TaxID=67326 RepID=A0ABZ1XV72_9ACTN|nr:Helicase associated domain protein [Streptomyces melanogenes]
MPKMKLRPHQVEAVDAVLRMLQAPEEGIPSEGLRTQVIAATGSGKTLIAVACAQRLGARRVLVLVPTLDLLAQMAAAWRAGGRHGAMVGVCSLRAEESDGIPCTTDPDELVAWLGGLESVTVFATYASVGLGILQRAHEAGVGPFDLMVVDEAHRTSGDAGKPWAAVHDQGEIPAARRLYMTATARVWEAPEGGRGQARLVASMDPDSAVFGPVAYKLKLSEAINRGLVAPYQVVCVDIRDPELHAAQVRGERGSDAVRGARLAALQTGLLTAAAKENLRKVLTFHSRVAEAEAMAQGVAGVAEQLRAQEPRRFPPVERVWADWLCGEHPPGHRRAVLDTFASDVIEPTGNPSGKGGESKTQPAVLRILSSVKVLGEGVDTAHCDAVAFCDARGSMVDIVQMVGRALRMKPGEGKIASLIVPVFLGPDEENNEMLTSNAYGTLAKILEALRAHDTETIEALADPRPRSGSWDTNSGDSGGKQAVEDDTLGDDGGHGAGPAVSRAAAELLKFSTPRDPAELARFVRLRVIEPENEYWRRGIQAATRYVKETGAAELRVPYDYVTPEDWKPARFPLGTWLADQRRYNNTGRLTKERVEQLGALGMVWSHQDIAFEEGLAVARAWAAAHGHFLPPATAVWQGYPIGVWAKNQRAAGRKALVNIVRREGGLPVDAAGAMTQERLDALDDIDPGWCPAWDANWQRCFQLTKTHLASGARVPTTAGEVIVQGEDLGRWVTAQRNGWDKLTVGQRVLLEILGLEPAGPHEQPVTTPTRDDKWALNLTAARQYHAREGHLNVPRKHIERLKRPEPGHGPTGPQAGGDGPVEVKLGTFLDNTRRRAAKLPTQRRAELDALGMRW